MCGRDVHLKLDVAGEHGTGAAPPVLCAERGGRDNSVDQIWSLKTEEITWISVYESKQRLFFPICVSDLESHNGKN